MTEENRKIGEQIWPEIQKSTNVLLHLHPTPDGDSIGSALATMHMLKGLGKKVTLIAGDSELPKAFYYLPGAGEIQLKNYSEVDTAPFDLFLILDSASKDRVSRLNAVEFPSTMRTVVIDHHGTNPKFGDINLVDPSYPATAQILYELFELWGVTVTKHIALTLFLGMFTDTGGFRFKGTTPQTLLYASKLAAIAPEYNEMLSKMENTLEPENLKFLSIAYSTLEHYFNNKVVLAPISFEMLKENHIEKRHTERMELANTLCMVEGWEVSISFIETEKDRVSVSLRTQKGEEYDLSKLAVALGGGGHRMAAGAVISKPFEEAKKFLLETIPQVYPELGK